MKLLGARKKKAQRWDFQYLAVCLLQFSCARSGPQPALAEHSSASDSATPVLDLQPNTARPTAGPGEDSALDAWVTLTFPNQGLELKVSAQGALELRPNQAVWANAVSRSRGQKLFLYHEAARRTVTLDECENVARGGLSLLRHGQESSHERPWFAPQGYSGHIKVVLMKDGSALVEGFGVGVSRCLSLICVVPSGPGFAARLAEVVEIVFPSLKAMPTFPVAL